MVLSGVDTVMAGCMAARWGPVGGDKVTVRRVAACHGPACVGAAVASACGYVAAVRPAVVGP
ncbi:hypothetical protein GCM10009733_062980 [Nonomuraea maheshkhaliensis]|uniref:Uncharacterized protein n=1 Tax=Nonomuraea maheshkhaliensis TaxID=419590 RepID=A0ABP4RSP0_9ACTN